ncbi:MAG: hypothetical protein H0V66_12640 [Bdellovibrionales bacterium]|nr:hypothetical protein [Bdellovibrionales bacterium]
MKLLLIFLIGLITQGLAQTEEQGLKLACSKQDLAACENLGAYYIKTGQWENALIIGEAICKKNLIMGCTFAGTAALAQGKVKQGLTFLNKSCDTFEPYACRSLARLMKKNREEIMAYIYFKRACHYGLKESCRDVKKPKETYSPAGISYLKKLNEDCSDTQTEACRLQLTQLEKCVKPLTQKDCLILPGQLSIYFRSKLMQEEAKISLMSILATEKTFRESAKDKTFSYDLGKILKEHKPLTQYHYVFGFMKACGKRFEKKRSLVTHSLELYRSSYKHHSSRILANIQLYFNKGKPQDCYMPTGGFEAYAVANLDPLNPTRLDVWKINQDNDIIHIQDGLPLP